MQVRPKTTTYVSIMLSYDEKRELDDAAERAGVNRNRFIRDWIATLANRRPR